MTFQPKASYVPPADNAKKELKAVLGFGIASATREPNPQAKDRSIYGSPARQGWKITLSNGFAIHLESSADLRDLRRLEQWRFAATRQLGAVEPLTPLTREQARRVLILLHAIKEETSC
jgi:hypothetical protein